MNDDKCNCANMNGNMCYPCLVKDYYAISADNFRLIHENQSLRAEVARLGSFLHPIATVIHDNSRKFAETLGSGEHISAPFGGTVKDVHSSCIDEIERLRALTGVCYSPDHGGGGLQGVGEPENQNATAHRGVASSTCTSKHRKGDL